jgi:O-antigen ligase
MYIGACSAFIAWLCLSSAFADAAPQTAVLAQYAKAAFFSLLVAGFVHTHRDFQPVAVYLCFAVLLASIFNVWQSFSGRYVLENAWAMERSRAAGARGDPNDTAMVIISALPLFWGLAADKMNSMSVKACYIGGFLVALGGVMLTASRSGFLATSVIVAILVLRMPSRTGIIMLLAGVGVFTMFASSAYWERMTTVMTGTEIHQGQSLEGRYDLARSGLEMFLSNPIIGVGAGNFGRAYLSYKTGEQAGVDTDPGPVAHNIYVQMLVEAGLLGFVLFCGVLFLGYWGLRGVQSGPRLGHEPTSQRVPIELGLVGVALMGMTLSQAHSSVLWLLLGLGGGALSVWPRSRDQATGTGQVLPRLIGGQDG